MFKALEVDILVREVIKVCEDRDRDHGVKGEKGIQGDKSTNSTGDSVW